MKNRRQKKVNAQDLEQVLKALKPCIEKVVSSLGFHVLKVVFVNENQTNYLRLTISYTDHPVSLDDCEIVSRNLEKELDRLDQIPFPYTLEVESPGINKLNDFKFEHEFTLEKLNLKIKA